MTCHNICFKSTASKITQRIIRYSVLSWSICYINKKHSSRWWCWSLKAQPLVPWLAVVIGSIRVTEMEYCHTIKGFNVFATGHQSNRQGQQLSWTRALVQTRWWIPLAPAVMCMESRSSGENTHMPIRASDFTICIVLSPILCVRIQLCSYSCHCCHLYKENIKWCILDVKIRHKEWW